MKKNEYSIEHITILKGIEAVRKRPAMYVGSTGFNGFVSLLKLNIENIFFTTESDFFEISFDKKMSAVIRFRNLKKPIIDSINENLSINAFEFAVLNFLSEKYQFTLFDKDKNILLNQVYKKEFYKRAKLKTKNF
jgi:hypothetical protein